MIYRKMESAYTITLYMQRFARVQVSFVATSRARIELPLACSGVRIIHICYQPIRVQAEVKSGAGMPEGGSLMFKNIEGVRLVAGSGGAEADVLAVLVVAGDRWRQIDPFIPEIVLAKPLSDHSTTECG